MKKALLIFAAILRSVITTAQTGYIYTSTGNNNLSSGNTLVAANSVSIGASSYNITASAHVDVTATNEIYILPGMDAAPNSSGNAHFYIDPGMLGVASFYPTGFTGITRYDRFEMGIRLPASIQSQINTFLGTYSMPANGIIPGINPYDPDQIRIECEVTPPSGPGFTRYGFYFQPYTVSNNTYVEGTTDYPFRVRIAPPQFGNYTCNIKMYLANSATPTLSYNNIAFDVIYDTFNPGNLVMAAANLQKMKFETGPSFFGIGQNLPGGNPVNVVPGSSDPHKSNPSFNYPTGPTANTGNAFGSKASPYTQQEERDWLMDLHNHHGNFVRMRLDPWSFPLEHADYRTLGVPTYDLRMCLNNYQHNQMLLGEFDQDLALCESNGIYIMLNIFQNQELDQHGGDSWQCGWQDFPYKALLNEPCAAVNPNINPNTGAPCPPAAGPCAPTANAIEWFFSDAVAKATFKKQLYYICARWGYSTNIAMWEMINETENLSYYPNPQNTACGIADNNLPAIVNSWVCDMGAYMKSFYPQHLVTNGTITDDATLSINNLAPTGCLDIYSNNSYASEIDKTNNTHNNFKDNLHKQGAQFFAAGRPYVHGELGLGGGECIYGSYTVEVHDDEDYNDRSFHNNLWATTVSGNLAAGLNWLGGNSANGIDHRVNYDALYNFTQNINWAQRLKPQRYNSNTSNETTSSVSDCNSIFHVLDNLYMMNDAKDFVAGWSMMYPSFWAYDPPASFPNYLDLIHCAGYTDQSNIHDYDITGNWPCMNISGALTREPPIEIRGMAQPNHPFRMEFFKTYGSPNGSWFSAPCSSDANGTIQLYTQFFNHPTQWDNGPAPDVAYMVHDDASEFFGARTMAGSNNHDGMIVLSQPADTSELPAVAALVNGQIKLLSVYNGNPSAQKINVFPNPAIGFVNLDYNEAYFTNAEITVCDISGKLVRKASNTKKLDLTGLDQGMYLVKFTSGQFEKTFKISVTK